ncbi:MAG: 50S ribosomal protein L25 [Vulcanimicrobiota bacterium]
MKQFKFKVQKREKTGKELCKKLRKEGKVPAVIYGKDFENILIKLDDHNIRKALTTEAGTRVILNLEVEDEKTEITTMVNEVQKDIYKKNYIHIDFQKISLDEKVQTNVPIRLTGESIGVKGGGVLDHLVWSVPVEGYPLDIPEKIAVDVTDLAEHDRRIASELEIPENIELLIDPDEVIAVVHPPRVIKLETAVEGEEGAEGEVGAAAEGEEAEAEPAAV